MAPDLSISIVNTNNGAMLRDCLTSIFAHPSRYRVEVLVVDNASCDGSAEMVRALFPQARLSVNEARLGFAQNNNINLRVSRGRYVMLLNEDTLVRPGSLDAALDFLDETPDYAGVACRMINPDGTLQESSTRRLPTIASEIFGLTGLHSRFPRSRLFAFHVMGARDPDRPFPVELPLEAGMIVRRSMVEQIGYLDEGYFIFGEGPEWCHRIKAAGGKLMYLPACEIVHFGGASTGKLPRVAVEEERFRSNHRYFRRAQGPGYAAVYRAAMLTLAVAKLALHALAYGLGARGPGGRRHLELDWCVMIWALGLGGPSRLRSEASSTRVSATPTV